MSDLLSASSLLMAIAAILFSLWYADIAKALEVKPGKYSVDNVASRQYVGGVIFSKAVPVATMAGLVAIIFIPDAIKIFVDSLEVYKQNGLKILWTEYNAVKTAYCYVSLLSAVLAIYMFRLVGNLISLYSKLK